jgi:DNA-binding NarL/FixJ family response regulator
MNNQPIRVLLADDHPIFLASLRALLERHGYLIVGEATSGEEAIPLAARYHPQIVVMDLEMPGLGGLASIPRIRAAAPASRILILSAHDEPQDRHRGAVRVWRRRLSREGRRARGVAQCDASGR